jgi:hypothetical protein
MIPTDMADCTDEEITQNIYDEDEVLSDFL